MHKTIRNKVATRLQAVLHKYYQEDGSVIIPKVLRLYMGGKDRKV